MRRRLGTAGGVVTLRPMGARRPLLIASALATAAGAVFLASLTILRLGRASPSSALALEAFSGSLILGLLAVAGSCLARRPVSLQLGLRRGRLSGGTLVLVALGFVGLSHSLETLLRLLELRDTGVLAEIDARLQGLTLRQFGTVLLGLGIAPGIGEELFFRGLVQRGLEPRLGSLAAILLAAAAFGALHVDPVHGGAAFALGLYLGTLTLWAGSVRVAMGCHVLNNALAVLEAALGFAPVASAPLSLTGGAALAGVGLVAARRQARRVLEARRAAPRDVLASAPSRPLESIDKRPSEGEPGAGARSVGSAAAPQQVTDAEEQAEQPSPEG